MSTEKSVVFLEGERLYLRAIEEGDLDISRRWVNDPEVRKFLNRVFPLDVVAEAKWHEDRDRGAFPRDITFVIVLKDSNRHIGNMGLHGVNWVDRNGTTGAVIGEKEFWGKGYGHEAKELLLEWAFDTLNLHRVNSCVLASNPRSIACLKKSGYKEEGRIREAFFRGGEWVDDILLGLLASDWRALRASRAEEE